MKFVGLFIISICLAECSILNVKEFGGENLNYGALPTYSAMKEYAAKLNGNEFGTEKNSLLPTQYGNNFIPTLSASQNAILSSYLESIRPKPSVSIINELVKPASAHVNVPSNSNLDVAPTVSTVSSQSSFVVSTNLQPQPQNPISVINIPQSPLETPITTINNPQPQPQNPSNIYSSSPSQTPTENIQHSQSPQLSSNEKIPPPPPQNPTANGQHPLSPQLSPNLKVSLPAPQNPTANVQHPPSSQLSYTIKFPQPPPPQNPTTSIKLPAPPTSQLSSSINSLPPPPKTPSKAPNRPVPPTSVEQNRPRPPVSIIQW